MCEALKELMAEEFQEVEERVTERVTEQVTEQLICNAYKNVGDLEKVSEILGVPVETVRKAVGKEK